MLTTAFYLESTNINPYYNLALEESLFNDHQTNSIIFYLWQNHHTVVIGKNQNAYKECHLKQMELDHCYLVRRSTGGGAVYHDLGNLNFTFITDEDNYDIEKQSEVIIKALEQYGITAKLSGRNDIEVEGKKISGNAFLTKDGKKLQHGTLLVNIEKASLLKYLNVSSSKIKAKGVDSVQSRVENITTYNHAITVDNLKVTLKKTFEELYQLPLQQLVPPSDLNELIEKYHSYNYIYNKIPDYTLVINERLSFGEVEIYVNIVNDYIMNLQIYTDAIPLDFIERLRQNINMTYIDDAAFAARLKQFPIEDQIYLADIKKILNLIKEKNNEL